MSQNETKLIKSYAAKLLARQAEFFNTQLEGIQVDDNIDFLHHTRVMSRRLRSTIEVFGPYLGQKKSDRWITSIRKLTKLLARVRDLDVQITFLEMKLAEIEPNNIQQGIARLLLRKKQKRLRKQENVLSIIKDFHDSMTMMEISNFIEKHPYHEESFYPPLKLVNLAKKNINEQLALCFSHVPFITNPENKSELHQLRISIKNLRYTTELFEPIYPNLNEFLPILKIFQDDLGKIHDIDVWLNDLDKFLIQERKRIQKFYGHSGPINLISPGIQYLKNILENDRIVIYETFLNHWNSNFQDQFWSRLRDQITEVQRNHEVSDSEIDTEENIPDVDLEMEDSSNNSI